MGSPADRLKELEIGPQLINEASRGDKVGWTINADHLTGIVNGNTFDDKIASCELGDDLGKTVLIAVIGVFG